MGKITANEVNKFLEEHLRSRSDLGVWKALQATILQSANPFESASVRRPQWWFVLLLVFTIALTAVFVYFNLLS